MPSTVDELLGEATRERIIRVDTWDGRIVIGSTIL